MVIPIDVSVVMPTYQRHREVADAIAALGAQSHPPAEIIIVDGAEPSDCETEAVVTHAATSLDVPVVYLRGGRGAASQRNIGLAHAQGAFVFFVDDDVRPEPDCLEKLVEVLVGAGNEDIACASARVVGRRRRPLSSFRWRVYRAIGLMTTSRPGAYDWGSGHALPRLTADGRTDLWEVDVVGGGCALWRADLLVPDLRFAPFFDQYFYNEDIHLALRARSRGWRICDVPAAGFHHTSAVGGRPPDDVAARHGAINRRFVFTDLVPLRTRRQECRFWGVEACEVLARLGLVFAGRASTAAVRGQVEGMVAAWRAWPGRRSVPTAAQRSADL